MSEQKGLTVKVARSRGTLEVTRLPITVDHVEPHPFRTKDDGSPACNQAQIRQVFITHYPGARFNSSTIEGLYDESEFGADASDYENIRVSWISVPLDKTKKDVEEMLAKFPEATIYRILGDEVEQVLSQEQLFGISNPAWEYDLDMAKRSKVVRLRPQDVGEDGVQWPMSKERVALINSVVLDPETGRIDEILDDTGFQYRSTGFTKGYQEDLDFREKTPEFDPSINVLGDELEEDPAKATQEAL
jgi:hypothetical protein